MNAHVTEEIAATAARLVVEEGLEYGPAKRRAVKQLGLNGRAELPDNQQLEDAVAEYIIEAVRLVADDGERLLPLYRFDPATGRWTHREGPVEPAQVDDLPVDAGLRDGVVVAGDISIKLIVSIEKQSGVRLR